jgi:hypothetical protein
MTLHLDRTTRLTIIAGFCLVFGCNQQGPRVYTAMPVDTEQDCLGAYTALGLVDAEELPATCAPVCLMQDDTLYVSTVCGPYPDEATLVTPDDSSDCQSALALLDADDGGACETE